MFHRLTVSLFIYKDKTIEPVFAAHTDPPGSLPSTLSRRPIFVRTRFGGISKALSETVTVLGGTTMSSSMIESSYVAQRGKMKPGDVIAFSGKGDVSQIIKNATRSNVSHVGVILQTTERGQPAEYDRYFNQIIESTSIQRANGVIVSRLSNRIDTYNGEIWLLPLKEDLREKPERLKKFYDFLFSQVGKGYDTIQAIKCALDALDQLPIFGHGPTYNNEDFSAFFCSELVAAALEEAAVTPRLNASEVTPIDLCRWNIFEEKYYLLKCDSGTPNDKKLISRFNPLDPAYWNY